MSLSQMDNTKKIISLPTVVSSFVGIMMAVPLAFALNAPMSASATQQANQATSQANVEDFAKFAFAFNQGYEAKATSATSNGGGQPASCSEATVSAGQGGGQSEGTVQLNSYVKPAVGGRGGGGSYAPAKMSRHTAAMMNSFNTYTSMINNSSSVSNVNSNNNVGSHNGTKTSIEIEDSKGVMVGVSNDSTNIQKNANQSFNEDSYNTKNETSIINDSFKKEVNNTTTNTTNTDINMHKETNVVKTEDSFNTDNSDSGNNSNNSLEVEVEANVDVNSHNEVTEVVPVILPALEDEALVTA